MLQGSSVRTLLGLQVRRLGYRLATRRADRPHDRSILQAVLAADSDADAMNEALVEYFWREHMLRLGRWSTVAHYPGWPSIYGAYNDAVEGVTRLAPVWAAYAASPDAPAERRDAMLAHLRRMLAAGCDPAHAGYWGNISDRSTLICEATDVALAVWLARETLWQKLPQAERIRIANWLRQALGRQTADNNWHLFVVIIDAVLEQLDPSHSFSSAARLERVMSFYAGDGCFKDGPDGRVDFYNAWGFHYLLFWLDEIGARGKSWALSDRLAEFCSWYQWLFTPNGLPLFGRSLCYRLAVSGPLISCALRRPDVVRPGVALRAYLTTWRFFVERGALQAGRPTQGVFEDDVRWLDPYSGPCSSFWGTRSLVLFLYAARAGTWRAVDVHALPSETRGAAFRVSALGATVSTDPARGTSQVDFDGPGGTEVAGPSRLRRRSWRDRLREFALTTASRPANNLLALGHRRFTSALEEYR